MTYEKALALSANLVAGGVPHTIEVGHNEQVTPEAPTDHPAIHCRVNTPFPRYYGGGLARRVALLEEIANRHDLVVGTSILSDGLTFATPTPGRNVPTIR